MAKTRPALAGDGPFLYELYASTRIEEVVLFGWSEAQLQTFLQLQFSAQSRSYAWQYPAADRRIILDEGGQPIGSLLVDRSGDAVHLVDIALLPGARGAGLGTAVIRELQSEAASAGKPFRLAVLRLSPALRLYQRLGLQITAENDLHYTMQSP